MLKIIKERKKQQLQLNNINYGKSIKTITFYISDHGFGHASRNIPIIRYILHVNNNIRIIVKTGIKQGQFIENSLKEFNERILIYFDKMDVGLILNENSLEIDKDKLYEEINKYISTWNKRVSEEVEFLKYNNVNLVVSDIVPWIFKASKYINIPSILISNFTWVDIYKEYFNESILNEYINAYKLADKVFLYNLYIETMTEYLKDYEEVGLCCRKFNEQLVNVIKEKHDRKIVFVSVGRSVNLSKELDVSKLAYDFIVTEGIKLTGNNVTYLPKEILNTQDYIKASDYIITKAGWTTISEILCAGKKCAVLSRNSVAEDRSTINKLKHMNMVLEVKYGESFNIRNIIEDLEKLNSKKNEYKFVNNYKDISRKILSYIREI